MSKIKNIKIFIVILFWIVVGFAGYRMISQYFYENATLKRIITRLEADSRVAEVLVTGVNYNETDHKTYTTIKFLEYDTKGQPLKPQYFNFSGNIIQFQSLVIRFDDLYVRRGDKLKGKSAYLFWKVFMLDGKNTQEYDIAPIHEVPQGYKLETKDNSFEKKFWANFWKYVLDSKKAKSEGIKNAQIEAPGTIFIPGNLYTIKIEHDGGLRIDTSPLSEILRGEKIP